MSLFLCVLILVGLGIACVYTASYPRAIGRDVSDSFYFAGRQIWFAVAGLGAMFAFILIPLETFHRHAKGIAVLLLLVLVAVLLVGEAKHGNKAWFQIGSFTMQPSEFAKVGVILVLSAYLAKRPWVVKSARGLMSGPIWFLIVPVGLVVAQGDLGTAVVMAAGTVVLLAVSGAKFRHWGVPLLVMLGMAMLLVLNSHRAVRIQAWLHPFDTSIDQTLQPRFSLIAVGSGGLLGRGFCMSREKWFYLPAPHNDYILAIMAEELGFLRLVLFLFVPYAFLVYRGFTVAHRARDEFGALVATGCTVMLATQALMNMAVVLNLFPTMGINLPFISYGGTSVIASMMMAGLLLNVSATRTREARRQATLVEQPARV